MNNDSMEKEEKVNDLAKRIVDQDIFANVDSMVRYILEQDDHNAPFDNSSIEYNTPDYDSMDDDEINDIMVNEYSEDPADYDDINDKIEFLKDNYEQPEVYEYWLVSGWLAGKLRDQGEVIIDDYIAIWGRSTTGQAIYLDGVIQQIAKNLQNN